MPLIYGMSWKHPAILLFVANMLSGALEMFIESKLGIGKFHSDLFSPLVFFGLFMMAWIPLYIIANPEDLVPKRSFTLDAEEYGKRWKLVRRAGYAIGIAELFFIIYRIFHLASRL